jgi:hypothetical protein
VIHGRNVLRPYGGVLYVRMGSDTACRVPSACGMGAEIKTEKLTVNYGSYLMRDIVQLLLTGAL